MSSLFKFSHGGKSRRRKQYGGDPDGQPLDSYGGGDDDNMTESYGGRRRRQHGGTLVPAALVLANHGLGRGRDIKDYKTGHFSRGAYGVGRSLRESSSSGYRSRRRSSSSSKRRGGKRRSKR